MVDVGSGVINPKVIFIQINRYSVVTVTVEQTIKRVVSNSSVPIKAAGTLLPRFVSRIQRIEWWESGGMSQAGSHRQLVTNNDDGNHVGNELVMS